MGTGFRKRSCVTVKVIAPHAGGKFGMQIHAIHWPLLALGCALAAVPVAARAQECADIALPADGAPSPDDSAVIGKALVFDAATLAGGKPPKPPRLPRLSDPKGPDVSRSEKPDGSSTVVVKQPLPTTDWDATLGADLGLASTAPETDQAAKPILRSRDDRGSGAAWASVGVPNLASIDARVDPSKDQGKLGTTFKQTFPVGGKFALTLQNSYSVTETFGAPAAAPADVPLTATPQAAAPQVWGNEKAAKFDILPTGTTFGASLASKSTDPVTHNTFSAEQKLYGPLHVTTAVFDVVQPTTNKKITAGFKHNW